MKAANLFINSSLPYKICQSEKPGHSGFQYAFWLLLHYITAQRWFLIKVTELRVSKLSKKKTLFKPVLSRLTVTLEHAHQLYLIFAWCSIQTSGSFCHLLEN